MILSYCEGSRIRAFCRRLAGSAGGPEWTDRSFVVIEDEQEVVVHLYELDWTLKLENDDDETDENTLEVFVCDWLEVIEMFLLCSSHLLSICYEIKQINDYLFIYNDLINGINYEILKTVSRLWFFYFSSFFVKYCHD